MQLLTTTADAANSSPRLTLSLATTQEEVREVQRLRYKVFIETMGLVALQNPDGLDHDEFDAYCDHLVVRDTGSLKVVGTYRVMSPHAARTLGQYYSEKEFDLSRLDHLRPRIAEAGRACIHPDYRSGSVIMLLWAGLAAFMKKEQCDYLIGCASISLADGGHNAAALYRALAASHQAPSEYRVTPHLPFPMDSRETGHVPRMPPLLKGYLRSGAWVCGEAAWDPDFHSADLFMLLPLARLDSRYARHYLGSPKTVSQ
ncbi:GNAT family N-acetyltransferase [Actimicrobium antarcticum]|uniref:L-ornithine N(alpha)-acyltransferase n=1 Tax=Actimicrobium antarcticum TaxID=1051899 RepID=A0ABP7U1A2_9BURK